jgi:hypothetical protein
MSTVGTVEAVSATFTAYAHAFQTLEPDVAAPYCHAPCLFISPRGVRAMVSALEVRALLAQVMADLRDRGYSRSEVTSRHVQPLGERIALLTVNRVRIRTDGTELERVGETYTFLETVGGWRIVAAAMHDFEATLQPM